MSAYPGQRPGFQPPPHPTVDYGQQGGQQQLVVQPYGQPQFAPQQPAPPPQQYHGYDPAYIPPPLPQNPQPGQPSQAPPNPYVIPPQPQQPPPQQQHPAQPQPQVPVGYGYPQPQYGYPQPPAAQINPNQVLSGPGVPTELQGRTWGQAMQIYSNLAQDYIRRMNQQQAGYGQAPPVQYQQQASPAQAPAPQGYQRPTFGRQYPGQQQDLSQVVRQEVQQALAPVTAMTSAQAAREARQAAAQLIPDWNELAADVDQMLGAADPISLSNPEVWESAANLARGKRFRPQKGGGVPMPSVVQTPYGLVPLQGAPNNGYATVPMPQAQPQPYYGIPVVPAPQAPIPQYQFFTEGPTAPAVGMGQGLLTPQERDYARKMGMDDSTYLAWKGGVIR